MCSVGYLKNRWVIGRLFIKKRESVNFTFIFEQFTQSNFLEKTSLQKVSGLRDSLRVVIMLPESAKCRSLGAAVAGIPVVVNQSRNSSTESVLFFIIYVFFVQFERKFFILIG